MGLKVLEPNTCIRGCCSSQSIPLHLPPSSYTLLSPIARGAESVVYEATLDGRKVAVKKPILSTSEELDNFHKELQLLCKLDHPGLAKFVAAHAKPPNYMFFFEFYESRNLAEKLHVEEWSPSVDQVLMIAAQLAKALQYLHNRGIVHRDVKPANVLLDRNLCPHLADFGLAEYRENLKEISLKNWRSSGKPTGGFHKKNMVGTLIYMAPEILKKEIHSEKSDVYSFGISINELLTGVVPYTDLRAEAQAHTVLEMNYTEQQLTAAVVSALELDLVLEHRKSLKEEDLCAGKSYVTYDDKLINSGNNMHTYHESINWTAQGEHSSKKASHAAESDVKLWLESANDALTYYPVLSWGSFATCGRRETMEDTHFLMPHMYNQKEIHMFGIFDGHRGSAAAEFSARALPGFLQNLGSTTRPTDALLEAFIRTDVTFRNELDSLRKSKRVVQKDWHPGCTAIAALIVRNRLFVANAGDCRAILCRGGHPFALSRDHVASCLAERERVVSAGGNVNWQVDTWRVGPPALQVTRSIGDDDLKPAVTAEPEITETIMTPEDEYLVMASDGLWDVVSHVEAVGIIKDTVKEPGMCSKRLATEAAERGSKDNITVIVVFLQPVSTAERIY
ncbi:protein kinase and PP2C-like domain-containing protein isoform X2 [Citrus clementina]|uniref:protein kinase and PP2C-like domain-containing protein isoform X2 n=1 Tax=Citrus clementina TaxID=85681 RepID=UPI000CED7531|nr:protein kinase and PP2C-like domain-containing protein isoform X2 [Citrus x clementina]